MAEIPPGVVKTIAALVHLPLTSERAAVVAKAYSGLLNLLDKLQDADVGTTEPAATFQQKPSGSADR